MSDTWSEPVDLTNCDREPIHQLGAIQPIGFLIALSSDWMISRLSANINQFVAKPTDEIIGHHVNSLLCPDAVHALRNRMALLRGPDGLERMFRCALLGDDRMFDVALHMSEGRVIIEGEPSTEHHYGDATGTVRGMIGRLDQARDMPGFFNEGARQVRALTGFDRVMIYRFSPDGSGEVVSESAKSGIGSFLGLHYPATDIPKQARELYKRSLLRVITDIDATPVPILPTLDEHGQPLDLSLSVLRSVSPMHIEYLRNMGVRASMSISIVVEGELWGLIACHHYSPRCPSFERRSVAELFAQMFAMRIEVRERKETVEYERRARDVCDQLLGAVASDESLLKDPDWLLDILTRAIPADGVGVWINGNYAFAGKTPDTANFTRIVRALNGTAAGRAFATDRISRLVPEAIEHAGAAAGMLAIPISRSPRDYVILFRSEMIRAVRWGGDPRKPVEDGPNGPRLTPRESFAEWKQLVEGQSEPFNSSDLRVAETLRATLIEIVLRLSDEASEERRLSSERQELLIAELNHRVRNILSLIRGLIRQSKPPEGTSLAEFVAMIDGRIHALARAHNQITDDRWGPAPLQTLIDAEAAVFLANKRRQVEIDGEPILLNPQAYSCIALVIHELVTNSAKYGSLSDGGRVRISWHRNADRDLELHWIETGGPRVELPTRKGFGTTIIKQSVPYDLGGLARLEYAPDGFNAWFTIPERHLTDPCDVKGRPNYETCETFDLFPVPDNALTGMRVLLVEDSLIIALDAEDLLKRLGAREVVTEGTVADALHIIDSNRPDIAILDINLGSHTSFAIADRLDAVGVPFMFATGYGEQLLLPEQHRARIVLQKPYTMASLARRLTEALSGSTQLAGAN
ncbi:HWE histidine kinase domain-containing protein [Sphingomonas sp.]|uniref:HWE histidine kinase domain-containing protein n=1 Tax=Sphingomonas sp. TaxID=28214 RepID=UPI00286A793C|nr:HWE histidine kinase domain-containing protein [Sphingomonas sp.]